MFQIKVILNDLVNYTYKNSSKLEEYQKFYIELSKKNLMSKHGDYQGKIHRIRIFNLYRADAAIVATTIHELAHHIDYVNRGKSDHGEEFYAEFKKLLYMGLNMGLFSKTEFLNATKDASDSNKIAKIIKDYQPVDVGYKSNRKTIEVFNCYEQREILKEKGYGWNKINKAWEKEVCETDTAEETAFLEELGVKWNIRNTAAISFKRKNLILAGKGSYDIRDELKSDGFRFSENKKWEKEGTEEELMVYRKKYPDVEFKWITG